MSVRILLQDAHLKPSPRLLVGVAFLASLLTFGLWGGLGRWALLAWVAALPVLALAARYVAGSWVRSIPPNPGGPPMPPLFTYPSFSKWSLDSPLNT